MAKSEPTHTIQILIGAQAGRDKILSQRGFEDGECSPELSLKLRQISEKVVTVNQASEGMAPYEKTVLIIADVRSRGDKALCEWTSEFDRVVVKQIVVSEDDIEAGYNKTPQSVREALSLAAARIRAFHEKAKPRSWLDWSEKEALGQKVTPLARVGVYVPGRGAQYPSSLLMACIPAQVAGVREIEIATPPAEDGHVATVVLAAAKIAGISRVLAMGGAQGIAALAYGTASIKRVDKIVGPGGRFVTLAKRQVFGVVGIDGLYGPTETLLIADDSANPEWVAADLLAQAEHGEDTASLLITTSYKLAAGVARELDLQMATLKRKDIILKSIKGRGTIVVVSQISEAIELANEYAPEHLCLLVRNPWEWVGQVENAGGVFVGEWTNEALGDYMIGPSHVMPTAGTARFTSALSVNDFCKITSVFSISETQARALGDKAATLADAEGLTAHASAIRKRITRPVTGTGDSAGKEPPLAPNS